METTTDNDLAMRWKTGDVEAYSILVGRHLDGLHRYVRARCGSVADADDVCQDVFLDVCQKIAHFDPAYSFVAWIYMIARNKVVDRFRRQRPHEEFRADSHGGEDDRHPSSIMEERESAAVAWHKVFMMLPEHQATALWLRVQRQMSMSQIAMTMGQSETNVKVLLFRARQHLAREWKMNE